MTEIQIKQTGLLSVNTLIVPVCDNKVFIVDPAACSISGDSFSFLNFLKTNNLECIGIVLTHSHFDHITGLFELKEIFPNAKIAIHKEEASEIQAGLGPMNQSILQNFGMSSLIPFFNQFVNPDILLQDKNNLSVFAQSTDKKLSSELKKWIVIHTPGAASSSAQQDRQPPVQAAPRALRFQYHSSKKHPSRFPRSHAPQNAAPAAPKPQHWRNAVSSRAFPPPIL